MMHLLPFFLSLVIMLVPVMGPGDWKKHTNITKIDNNLYTGRDPDDDHIPELKKYGIKTIVSIRMNGQPGKMKQAHELGMNYFHLPVGFFHRPTKQVYHFVKIMSQPQYHPVYISCSIGMDRSSGFVAVYKARLLGLDGAEAVNNTKGWIFKKQLVALLDTWRDECAKGKLSEEELALIPMPKEGSNANDYGKLPGENVLTWEKELAERKIAEKKNGGGSGALAGKKSVRPVAEVKTEILPAETLEIKGKVEGVETKKSL